MIIAGFGRFGQITGRILAANDIPFTALDNNAEHIEFVKKFGNKVFYGDSSRLDLLNAAGIEHARIVLVALDDEEASLRLVRLVRENYPDIRLVVRAHNRRSVLLYRQLGVHSVVREVMGASLSAANLVLHEYGFSDVVSENMVRIFEHHDDDLLKKSLELGEDMDALIDQTLHNREQLADLFQQDREEIPSSNP